MMNLGKFYAAGVLSLFFVTSCTPSISSRDYPPIPGSITYKGQPRTKLTKVPIGSTFSHEINLGTGDYAIETYQVQPDRSLKIVNRYIRKERMFF
jgi:hypothetical protein